MKDYNSEEEFLLDYNIEDFERSSVTNDILIFTTEDKGEENNRKIPKKGLQILLVKRKSHPEKDKWALPGGFVDFDEGIDEGAIRKLKEKTGIDEVYLEQLYTFGDIDRDARTRVISVGNIALIDKEAIKSIKSDDTKWFWVEKSLIQRTENNKVIINEYKLSLISDEEKIVYRVLETIERSFTRKTSKSYELLGESSDKIAFDHFKMIDYGIDRLRNKVEYTPIAFNLLPRLFTVKELQYVYEAIMGREILNFRRKMGEMIIETDEVIEGKPFRPAKVFKFNEDWYHEF